MDKLLRASFYSYNRARNILEYWLYDSIFLCLWKARAKQSFAHVWLQCCLDILWRSRPPEELVARELVARE